MGLWHFLAPLLLFIFSPSSLPSSHAQCHPDQSDALLKLKQRFRPPVSVIEDSWRPGTDCCRNWTRVTCHSASGDVVALDLSGLSISGDLDPALFELVSLQSIDLSCNNLSSGSLPASLSFENLSNLTHLNLSDSGLSGEVPAGISSLRSLVSLDLSTPGLCSESSLTNFDLLGLIQNLSSLRQFYLDGVNVSAGGRIWAGAISSALPQLRELSMFRCSLSGPIQNSFSKLKFLEVLRLNENDLNTEVPEFFGNFSALRVLRLSSCGLRGFLPKSIFHLPFLQTLDLSKNPSLSGSLPDFLSSMPLQDLMLQSTNFSGTLPESVNNLKLLRTLLLSGCRFSGSLPSSLQDLTQLSTVDLSLNNFSGSIPSLTSLSNLSMLDLQNNSLSGAFPSWFFRLPSLRTLQLSSNQISGTLSLEISPNEKSSLETLDLSRNLLGGPIREPISRLQNLKILRLANNNLNGTLDLILFANLKNLSILDLSYNHIAVECNSDASIIFESISTLNLAFCGIPYFPKILANLPRLSRLDLSGNSISGAIPNWLWSSSSLTYLNLSYNSLTELEIPANLTGTSLNVIDLRSNKLQGQIPLPPPSNFLVDFSNNFFTSIPTNIRSSLNYTVFFSVSNNSLAGEIPISFCTAAYLQVLDLSHNTLSGQIPNCLVSNKVLQVLNLRNNNLSGAIPRSFPTERCNLRSLNLNGNAVNGKVPQTLKNCQNLEVLDFGNNEIEDEFPFWLGDLVNLRVLVLRSNKFFGSLPRSVGRNSSFSSLRIMDISSNRFNGNLPSESFLSWKAMRESNEISGGTMVLAFGIISGIYYGDSVTVTNKGLELTLVKILTIFTSLDVSQNDFEGEIPPKLMELRALHVLNMSRNRLSGSIPSGIGGLVMLESLDLSRNEISGEIPLGLASLSFLSFLDLSYNKLVGRIPTGRQFQTFKANSFLGNEGLCGEPLPTPCSIEAVVVDETFKYNWGFILIGAGYGGGVAMIFGLFFLWGESWRWYKEQVDSKLLGVLIMAGFCQDLKGESEERFEEGREDHEEDEIEDDGRRFCVFCTRLEFTGQKLVIRHVACSCSLVKEI